MKLRSGKTAKNSESNMDETPTNNEASEKLLDDSSPKRKSNTGGFVKYEWPTVVLGNRRFNCVFAALHFNVFLYAAAFFIQMGVLPYLNKKLGADPVTFGYLQTTFSAIQLAGGPPFGRFGDLYGGRAALTLAFAASALSYGIMSITYTIPMLFLSRVPSAAMHAMQGGQMIATDMTDSKDRASALGQLSFAYGIGMIVGPFLGGFITKYFGEQSAAFFSFVISLFSCMMCLYLIPPKTKVAAEKDEQSAEATDNSSIFSFKKYATVLNNKEACVLLSIKLLLSIPLGIFHSMFAIIVLETFQLNPVQNGYLMSYVGFLVMIMQGGGVGFLKRRYSDNTLMKAASFGLIWAWIFMSFVQSVWQMCVVIIPQVIAQVIINLIVTSSLTTTVSAADSGVILGMNMALHALVRTISPTIGGYLLKYYGFESLGYFGFVVSAVVTVWLFIKYRK